MSAMGCMALQNYIFYIYFPTKQSIFLLFALRSGSPDDQFLHVAELVVAADDDLVAGFEAREYLVLLRVLSAYLYLCLASRLAVGREAVNPAARGCLVEVATGNDNRLLWATELYLHTVALTQTDVARLAVGED